jgi:hypothetical protein
LHEHNQRLKRRAVRYRDDDSGQPPERRSREAAISAAMDRWFSWRDDADLRRVLRLARKPVALHVGRGPAMVYDEGSRPPEPDELVYDERTGRYDYARNTPFWRTSGGCYPKGMAIACGVVSIPIYPDDEQNSYANQVCRMLRISREEYDAQKSASA